MWTMQGGPGSTSSAATTAFSGATSVRKIKRRGNG